MIGSREGRNLKVAVICGELGMGMGMIATGVNRIF